MARIVKKRDFIWSWALNWTVFNATSVQIKLKNVNMWLIIKKSKANHTFKSQLN